MWDPQAERLGTGTLRWSPVSATGMRLSFERVASCWASDAKFRQSWIANLRMVPFEAYCWECPPLHETNLGRDFECVMIASPSLSQMRTDPYAFAEHFPPGRDVVTFANLGGDAMLVAPCPEGQGDFAHLASFTATASAGRQDALWRAVGDALAARIGPRPIWLSTAGHGVAWLHVRLDSRPKYYRHSEYVRT
jgi:hypothetical protein